MLSINKNIQVTESNRSNLLKLHEIACTPSEVVYCIGK